MKARAVLTALIATVLLGGCATVPATPSLLASLPKIASVDERFQSYNVEMVEVTGGRFWAPYGGAPNEMFRQRPPENLTDPKLRALARHLGPAYVRVSGTWANSTYLEAEGEHLAAPPAGYNQVLTRAQWRGLVDFAKAVNAKIGVSYAVSDGPRDANGVWKPEQAQRLVDLTRKAGGQIAFAEFINEPNAATLGRLPKDYSIANYTRDFRIFRDWATRSAPEMKIVGPGGVGEGAGLKNIPVAVFGKLLLTEELMKAGPNSVDAVSYHFYGDVSQRCANMRPKTADRSAALSPEWLDLTLRDWKYYSDLRDTYEPGDPMWITETAQAACGGSPWAASFVDTFRYVNQLGLLAQKGVQVIMHNTLAASDYSLIEEDTRIPRPNYWAAVLWKRTMGTTVLSSPPSPSPNVRLFAHCLAGNKGGIGVAAINLGDDAQPFDPGANATIWSIEAPTLDSRQVTVNGHSPALASNGQLIGLQGSNVKGAVSLPGRSITFIAVPSVHNASCS